MAFQLTEDLIVQYKSVFMEFDKNGDGLLKTSVLDNQIIRISVLHYKKQGYQSLTLKYMIWSAKLMLVETEVLIFQSF